MNQLKRVETAAIPPPTLASYLIEQYAGAGTTVAEFTNDLPIPALGLDIGAGRSELGSVIASNYSDINWINFDIQYNNELFVQMLRREAPERVEYQYGDVLAEPGKPNAYPRDWRHNFDLVCSWNLIGHLLRIEGKGREIGETALRHILELPKDRGRVMIGPVHRPAADSVLQIGKSVHLSAYSDNDAVEAALDALTIRRSRKRFYAAMDSGVSMFSASRFDPELKGRVLFDHNSEPTLASLKPLASIEGLKLGFRLARYLAKPKKFDKVN